MTDKKVFEIIVSYVPVEKVLLRMEAVDAESAKKAVMDRATDSIRDVMIEKCEEVDRDTPIPENYMSMQDILSQDMLSGADETAESDVPAKKLLN